MGQHLHNASIRSTAIPQSARLTNLFRWAIFGFHSKSGECGLIFTDMWAFDRQSDGKSAKPSKQDPERSEGRSRALEARDRLTPFE
ncbi:MAG: hypothetical protein Q4E13_01140 [Clostridia bacterium]|nr:hypothetical protein [Clostridia bacterium]